MTSFFLQFFYFIVMIMNSYDRPSKILYEYLLEGMLEPLCIPYKHNPKPLGVNNY